MLLNNANMDDVTLVNAKLGLVKYAKNCKEKDTSSHNSSKMVPISALTPLMIAVKELDETVIALKSDVQGSTAETAQTFQKVNEDMQSAIPDLFKQQVPIRRQKTIQEMFPADDEELHFDLDDAVIILRELTKLQEIR